MGRYSFIVVDSHHLLLASLLALHEHITHNHSYPTFAEFVDAVLGFLRNTVPKNAHQWCDTITANFRIISQKKYRVIG